MRLLLFAIVVVNFQVYGQASCEKCIEDLSNDLNGPVVRFMNESKNSSSLAAAEKAQWCLCKLTLDLCSPCLSEGDRAAMNECVKGTEELLRQLDSNVPQFEYDAYRSSHSQIVMTNSNGPSDSNVRINTSASAQPDPLNDDLLDKKIRQMEYNNGKRSGFLEEKGLPTRNASLAKGNLSLPANDQSLDEKINQIEASKKAYVQTQKSQAVSLKSRFLTATNQKINSSARVSCISFPARIDLSKVPLSAEFNRNSLDGRARWSVWVQIPETGMAIRFSKKVNCQEPRFPNTANAGTNLKYVMDGSDQFFDYGFFQLRNESETIVHGHLTLLLKGDRTTRAEQWPVYLEPREVMEDSIGNWYSGCEILELTVKDVCKG
jgi:hypothetical protein